MSFGCQRSLAFNWVHALFGFDKETTDTLKSREDGFKSFKSSDSSGASGSDPLQAFAASKMEERYKVVTKALDSNLSQLNASKCSHWPSLFVLLRRQVVSSS